jgi:hypothetical protein
MADYGLNITTGDDMTRIKVSCEHQNGLIYVVPAERSWVCASERLPAHAMAGFFKELVALQQPIVRQLMHDWGIYYRELPIIGVQSDASEQQSTTG